MYPVSNEWKSAVMSDTRTWAAKILIETAYETIEIDERGIGEGSMQYNEGVTDGANFGFGCAYKDDFSVVLLNDDGAFDDVQLNGAIVRPFIGLEVTPGALEYVPLGVYVIDTVSGRNADFGQNSRIGIEAFNVMCRFEKPLSKVNIAFPCTALQLLIAICQDCGVPLGSTDFLNKDYMISSPPKEDLSCRNALSCIAEIAGCWARCNRSGQLELDWFDNPTPVIEANIDGNIDGMDGGSFTGPPAKAYDGGLFSAAAPVKNITPMHRVNFVVEDAPITPSGVILEQETGNIMYGSDRNAITISDNPLIQDNAEEVVASLWEKLRTFSFLPYTSSWQGDPAIQAGDMITQTDRKGRTFRTIVTQSTFVFRKPGTLYAGGKSDVAVGYVDPITRAASRMRTKLHDKQQQLDAQDVAARLLFALFSGVAGGYRIDGDELGGEHKGRMYLAIDSPDIEAAQKVWSYSVAGIFFFQNGIHNPPSTAWGNDGSALFSLVTADMIRTGLLQSNNGRSWINMDDGSFSFGDGALEFINGMFAVIKAARITNASGDHYFYVGIGPGSYDGAAFVRGGNEYFGIWPATDGTANVVFSQGNGNIRSGDNIILSVNGNVVSITPPNANGICAVGHGAKGQLQALNFQAAAFVAGANTTSGYAFTKNGTSIGWTGTRNGLVFQDGICTGIA